MGLQQNASLGIAYDVGEELVMLPDRREALRHTLIFSPDDVGHGQRQDALGGFAQGAVEDLIHLAPNDHRGNRGGGEPEDRQHKAE